MDPKEVGKRVEKLIEEANISKEELANEIGITVEELEEKLVGKEEFYVGEVIVITEAMNLSVETVAKVFFGMEVDKEKLRKHKLDDSNATSNTTSDSMNV